MKTYDLIIKGATALAMDEDNTTIVDGKVVYRRDVYSCGVDEGWLAERVRSELWGG